MFTKMHIVSIRLRYLSTIKTHCSTALVLDILDIFDLFQVCLDNIVTTEKELDTVEVLKAIQKSKEVKYKLSNSDKKVSLSSAERSK